MPYKKKVTLRDLASQLNLTVHTVSKALRGLPGMAEETRKAVLELAREKGYRTKEQERGFAAEHIPLFPTKPRIFKYIVTGGIRYSLLHQYIQQGIQDKMKEFGHIVQTSIVHDESDGPIFEDWMYEQNIENLDGIFIPPAIESHLEQRLLSLKLPRVMINFPPPAAEVDSVIWDVRTSIWQSVRYLVSMNHTKILYIGDTATFRGFGIRWQAFQDVMREVGLFVNPENHVIGKFSEKERWVEEFVGKMNQMNPTAILSAVNDDLAWIYYACSITGKRIPEDCSLISLEDFRNENVPGLTRPVMLIREAGIRAAERMLSRRANPHQPYEHTLLQGPFFMGETVLPNRTLKIDKGSLSVNFGGVS